MAPRKEKTPPAPPELAGITAEEVKQLREESAALRVEIAELRKGQGDADALAGVIERLTAIEKTLAEIPRGAVVPLPGGGEVALPQPPAAPAKPAQEKKPQKKEGSIFDL